jgi:hypothetical protein
MRIIFLIFLSLLLSYLPGYCDNSPIKVELTTPKSEISFNEYEAPINIKITNTGPDDVQFPELDFSPSGMSPEYRVHLVTDDPAAFELNLHQTWGSNGQTPMTILKQGESFTQSMFMRIRSGRPGMSVKFKVGFKTLEDSTPVWSNPVAISIGNIENGDEKDLQLKVEASMKSNDIMQEKAEGEVHIRITNISHVTQSIVGPGIPAPCPHLSRGLAGL